MESRRGFGAEERKQDWKQDTMARRHQACPSVTPSDRLESLGGS